MSYYNIKIYTACPRKCLELELELELEERRGIGAQVSAVKHRRPAARNPR